MEDKVKKTVYFFFSARTKVAKKWMLTCNLRSRWVMLKTVLSGTVLHPYQTGTPWVEGLFAAVVLLKPTFNFITGLHRWSCADGCPQSLLLASPSCVHYSCSGEICTRLPQFIFLNLITRGIRQLTYWVIPPTAWCFCLILRQYPLLKYTLGEPESLKGLGNWISFC